MNEKEKEISNKIARWVYKEHRPVTSQEIATHFNLSIYTVRRIIHAILHRVDGTHCSLEVIPTRIKGQMRPIKYITIHFLPD
ncbi:TPA: HTH domain-containing protein [Salmonella enterica subsp. enterica serovar Concord]|nr:HTH domain-containing protein [Salmonella enterica subsp. enterica serovar Concord]